MATLRWKPNVTVAGIVARDGRFLVVEERTSAGLMINQPAGHLEDGETLLDAVRREVLEETACAFTPSHLTGVYQWRDTTGERTFLRFAFAGEVGEPVPGHALDAGIERALWLTRTEIAACATRHRSPWVLPCVDDFLAGRRAPLELFRDC